MLQIWFIGKRWNLVFASPPLLEIWARFVIELHSKWSCHLITLWPHICKGFKWSQIPTLRSSTVSSETQLLFQRPWAACKARSVIDTREQIYCGTPILMSISHLSGRVLYSNIFLNQQQYSFWIYWKGVVRIPAWKIEYQSWRYFLPLTWVYY